MVLKYLREGKRDRKHLYDAITKDIIHRLL